MLRTQPKTFYIGKYGIQQDNDCSIIALADYFEIPYDQAKSIATRNGLTRGGINLEGLLLSIWDLSGRKPKILKVELTLEQAIAQIDSGFIVTKNHVMQCSAFKATNYKGHEQELVNLLIWV